MLCVNSVLTPDWSTARPGAPLRDELPQAPPSSAVPPVAEEPGRWRGAKQGSDWRLLHLPAPSGLLGNIHEGQERSACCVSSSWPQRCFIFLTVGASIISVMIFRLTCAESKTQASWDSCKGRSLRGRWSSSVTGRNTPSVSRLPSPWLLIAAEER